MRDDTYTNAGVDAFCSLSPPQTIGSSEEAPKTTKSNMLVGAGSSTALEFVRLRRTLGTSAVPTLIRIYPDLGFNRLRRGHSDGPNPGSHQIEQLRGKGLREYESQIAGRRSGVLDRAQGQFAVVENNVCIFCFLHP